MYSRSTISKKSWFSDEDEHHEFVSLMWVEDQTDVPLQKLNVKKEGTQSSSFLLIVSKGI